MNKNLTWKLALIVATLLVFLFGIFGIPQSFAGQGLLAAMTKRIQLGLDLKGGTHLILQVQVNDAVKVDSDNAVEILKEQLNKRKIAFADISQPDPQNNPDRVVLKGVPTEGRKDLVDIVSERLSEYNLSSGPDNTYTLTMKPQMLSELKNKAVTQAIETIRNRIDQLGVTEPTIQEHGLGEYQILVQLPGIDDPARVKGILQSPAVLEIGLSLAGPFSSEAEAQAALASHPDGVVMMGRSLARGGANENGESWYIVARTAAVAGEDLRTAEPTRDENGRAAVRFVLTGEGGRKFAAFTGAHVGEPLAVVLDNKVQEVANIQEQIHDEGRITGIGDEQRAKDVAMVLRSGALPASITYQEERTVGPSLGADSIREGVRAAVIGMGAVLIFMLVYYRAARINANVGLILNLVILLGFLGFSGATLTLPGIAGVILTVGMGVDSNVLIFERIREEIRAGKTASQPVIQGFAHAWITIVVTHV